MRYFPYGMGGGYGFGLAWIPELIIWIVIIVAIIALAKSLMHHGGGYYMHGRRMAGEGPDALEILKQRYAKGEVTKKEFDEMKKDIMEQ